MLPYDVCAQNQENRRFGAIWPLVFCAIVSSFHCRTIDPLVEPDATPIVASDADDGNYPYPAPRTTLVRAVGAKETLEVATWNIENFPKTSGTVPLVADLIASMDLDMVALQEVEDVAAFNELVERLRGYKGLLSSHTYGNGAYQKIGYIYRTKSVTLSSGALLFFDRGYEFPRPPLKVEVRTQIGDATLSFTSLAVHLKAGEDAADWSRRQAAVQLLEEFLRTTVNGPGRSEIIVLGDFNSTLSQGTEVFAPFANATDRYRIRTRQNEEDGDFSFVPTNALLDHVVTTTALEGSVTATEAVIPRLDSQLPGYVRSVSDHLPVVYLVTP